MRWWWARASAGWPLRLGRIGRPVTVLERAAAPGEVGAGLSLWSNALRAPDVIGVGAGIRAHGTVSASGGVRASAGRWLSRSSGLALQERSGAARRIGSDRSAARRTLRGRAGVGAEPAPGHPQTISPGALVVASYGESCRAAHPV